MDPKVKEVKDKVSELKGAIKRLDSVRKHLGRNATDIKSDIHASVSRHLECLRGREVTLLGAVDQVLALKEEALQAQHARLNQALGILTTSLSMVAGTDIDSSQLTETLHRLNRVELSPEETPHISFRADHISLREAILSYGRVDANGLPLAAAFEDPCKPSASLPRRLEDYEDAEHHLFYKPVSGQFSQNSGQIASINVTIPKLSTRVEDWLQKKSSPVVSSKLASTPSSMTVNQATRPSSLPQHMRGGVCTAPVTPGSSCSLNNWLSLIKQHADLEEEHNFEIVDNTMESDSAGKLMTSDHGQLVATDLFSHIPKDLKLWLQPGSCTTYKMSSEFFKHIPSDARVWLARASQQLAELNSSRRSTSGNPEPFAHISKDPSIWLHKSASGLRVHKDGASNTNTSNKAEFFSHISKNTEDWLASKSETSELSGSQNVSADIDRWLSPSQPEVQDDKQKLSSTFELEDVCRANELCCSLNECVSKPDCLTMYMASEEVPAMPCSPKMKNQKIISDSNFTRIEDWLSPSSFASRKEELEKMSLDIEMMEKKEKAMVEEVEKIKGIVKDEQDNFFSRAVPSLGDPVWFPQPSLPSSSLNQAKVKGTKEEQNLWLQKAVPQHQGLTADVLKGWLMPANEGPTGSASLSTDDDRERHDSEGWSVISDTFSVQSDQRELGVAAADSYFNKWLM